MHFKLFIKRQTKNGTYHILYFFIIKRHNFFKTESFMIKVFFVFVLVHFGFTFSAIINFGGYIYKIYKIYKGFIKHLLNIYI